MFKNKGKLTVLILGLFFIASTAFAALLSEKHFHGGQNLNEGHKRGSDKHLAQILNEKVDYANLMVFTSAAGAGGAATAAMTVTGLKTTDVILSVVQKTPGANSLPLLGWSTVAANSVTAIWSADPGAGSVIVVTVKRPLQ